MMKLEPMREDIGHWNFISKAKAVSVFLKDGKVFLKNDFYSALIISFSF